MWHVLLRRTSRLGCDKQLFLIRINELDLNNLTPFYCSMPQAWNMTYSVSRGSEQEEWIMEEPLFHNSFIQTICFSSGSLRNCLIRAGCTKVKHLRDDNGWKTVESLQKNTGINSVVVLSQVLKEVHAALQESAENC